MHVIRHGGSLNEDSKRRFRSCEQLVGDIETYSQDLQLRLSPRDRKRAFSEPKFYSDLMQ